MVLAAPAVINSMNSAKKKSFQMYGEKMITKAMEVYSSQDMLGGGFAHKYTDDAGTAHSCYTLVDLGLGQKTGSYQGFVVVQPSSTVNGTGYVVYLTDNTYVYNGTASSDVLNTPGSIENTTDANLSSIQATMAKCK